MKLSELVATASIQLTGEQRRGDDPLVVIPLTRDYAGPPPFTSVRQAVCGSDWSKGNFWVIPSDPLDLIQYAPKGYHQTAEERLDQLAAAHKQLGFEYGCQKGKARRDWIDGFIEAMRMRFDGTEDAKGVK